MIPKSIAELLAKNITSSAFDGKVAKAHQLIEEVFDSEYLAEMDLLGVSKCHDRFLTKSRRLYLYQELDDATKRKAAVFQTVLNKDYPVPAMHSVIYWRVCPRLLPHIDRYKDLVAARESFKHSVTVIIRAHKSLTALRRVPEFVPFINTIPVPQDALESGRIAREHYARMNLDTVRQMMRDARGH